MQKFCVTMLQLVDKRLKIHYSETDLWTDDNKRVEAEFVVLTLMVKGKNGR